MAVTFLPDLLDQVARLRHRVDSGSTVYARRQINWPSTVTLTDSSTDDEVAVAISGVAPGGTAGGTLGGTYPDPTVNTDGSTLETSSNALRIKDGGITQAKLATGYRAAFEGTSAPSSPSAGDLWYDTTNKVVNVYNGTVWITITPASATVATSQTTTSTTYANLATTGPAVTVKTGTSALVTLGCQAQNLTASTGNTIAVAVSGATTLAAADANSVSNTAPGASYQFTMFRQFLLTGLTAGSNTFTMKYKVGSSTGTFLARDITVVGIPT